MRLEFYFDYRSPYAYLANTQVETLGVSVEYKPLDVVAVMKAVNNQPSPLCPPKARYAAMDAARWAKQYGVPYAPNARLRQAIRAGEIEGNLLSRLGLAAQGLGAFDRANRALFAAMWANDADLVSEEGRAAFLRAHDLPRDLFSMAADASLIRRLTEIDQEAAQRGVFGVPTMFINGEVFFGNDRLHFVKAMIDSQPLSGAAA